MPRVTFVTKTYRPDIDAFVTLHQSVLKHAADQVEHYAIVPKEDLDLFARNGSSRLKVQKTNDFLPPSFRALAPALAIVQRTGRDGRHRMHGELFVNLKRPWPPVRGWILQQIVKLAAVAKSDADVVVTMDSDLALIRPVNAETFIRDGAVRFYRKTAAVHPGMPRHLHWHNRARALLGIPDAPAGNPADHVSSLIAWDPVIVRRMLQRITEVTGKHWATALAAEWQLSECILYGVFVEHFGTARERVNTSEIPLCHAYWDTKAMDEYEVERFLDALHPDEVAIHIQSTSGTSNEIRALALRSAEERCLNFSAS